MAARSRWIAGALAAATLAAILTIPGPVSARQLVLNERCCFRTTVDAYGVYFVHWDGPTKRSNGLPSSGFRGDYEVQWFWSTRSLEIFEWSGSFAGFETLKPTIVSPPKLGARHDYSTAKYALYTAELEESAAGVDWCTFDTGLQCSPVLSRSNDCFPDREFHQGAGDTFTLSPWDNKSSSNFPQDGGWSVYVPIRWNPNCTPLADTALKDGFFSRGGDYWGRTISTPPLHELEQLLPKPGTKGAKRPPLFDQGTVCTYSLFKRATDHTFKGMMLVVGHASEFPRSQLPHWQQRVHKLSGTVAVQAKVFRDDFDKLQKELNESGSTSDPFAADFPANGCRKPA